MIQKIPKVCNSKGHSSTRGVKTGQDTVIYSHHGILSLILILLNCPGYICTNNIWAWQKVSCEGELSKVLRCDVLEENDFLLLSQSLSIDLSLKNCSPSHNSIPNGWAKFDTISYFWFNFVNMIPLCSLWSQSLWAIWQVNYNGGWALNLKHLIFCN